LVYGRYNTCEKKIFQYPLTFPYFVLYFSHDYEQRRL
jgi:hypothetical protein